MSVYEELYDNNIMKNRLIYILAILIVMFNGYVWTNIFDNYKEFHKDSVRELTLENERLNAIVEEFKLEGMEVTVTMYHPVRSQTDSTPDILADGTRIRVHKASEYRFIAVSRNLLKRHGGFLDYGDFIVLSGTGNKDGVYQVKDTMNKRWVNRIDILESPGTKPYKIDSATIMKTELTLTNNN
jgi:3D (Asp-Asp-Asp) domain-containing protein|tara:strand:- start:352 stop:903 length:552 start_codon:yes stop_codon:yes gene_type:complete